MDFTQTVYKGCAVWDCRLTQLLGVGCVVCVERGGREILPNEVADRLCCMGGRRAVKSTLNEVTF